MALFDVQFQDFQPVGLTPDSPITTTRQLQPVGSGGSLRASGSSRASKGNSSSRLYFIVPAEPARERVSLSGEEKATVLQSAFAGGGIGGSLGSVVPVVGNIIGGIAGGIGGAIKGLFGGGKSPRMSAHLQDIFEQLMLKIDSRATIGREGFRRSVQLSDEFSPDNMAAIGNEIISRFNSLVQQVGDEADRQAVAQIVSGATLTDRKPQPGRDLELFSFSPLQPEPAIATQTAGGLEQQPGQGEQVKISGKINNRILSGAAITLITALIFRN